VLKRKDRRYGERSRKEKHTCQKNSKPSIKKRQITDPRPIRHSGKNADVIGGGRVIRADKGEGTGETTQVIALALVATLEEGWDESGWGQLCAVFIGGVRGKGNGRGSPAFRGGEERKKITVRGTGMAGRFRKKRRGKKTT